MADQAIQPKPKLGHGERQAKVSLGVTLAIMMIGADGDRVRLAVAGQPGNLRGAVEDVPSGVMAGLVLTRTLGEDARLKAELPGHREYAARVKQRWIPGVW